MITITIPPYIAALIASYYILRVVMNIRGFLVYKREQTARTEAVKSFLGP